MLFYDELLQVFSELHDNMPFLYLKHKALKLEVSSLLKEIEDIKRHG